MRLALYEADIPPNVGTILRLAACLGVGVDLIEPCGFPLDDRRLRRAAMDYLAQVALVRHGSFDAFCRARAEAPDGGRLVLLTTGGSTDYRAFRYGPCDTLLAGRESAGVPAAVHELVDARVRIPLRAGLRSINVALACAIVLSEALRQTDGFPGDVT